VFPQSEKAEPSNYNSTKVGFAYFGFYLRRIPDKGKAWFILYLPLLATASLNARRAAPAFAPHLREFALEKLRAPNYLFAMRVLVALLLVLLSIEDLAWSQASAAQPQFRPALVGNGPKALVNVINTKRLVDNGQRDGVLMFRCLVYRSGSVSSLAGRAGYWEIYRETPGSKLLKEEVGYALQDCRFIPAIYNGERTDVLFAGTVLFFVSDGKPHLRIYANQSHDDIEKGNDFIAPQVIASTPDWTGGTFDLVTQKARVYGQNGAVQLSINVDANGNQRDLKVISEDPRGFGLGEGVRKVYAKAKWIPGFRNGHPVDCTFDYPEFFRTWKRP